VQIVDSLYFWTDNVLFWALMALRVWALADCVTRKTAAFPAADKLTKPAWIAILVVSAVLGYFFSMPSAPSSVLGVFSLVTTVVAAVYLADVRPAVRDIADGR
jgi:hypothetical protein